MKITELRAFLNQDWKTKDVEKEVPDILNIHLPLLLDLYDAVKRRSPRDTGMALMELDNVK